MSNYVCSRCGAGAYYDGRCGDGPILMCGCDKGQWINDGRGGYYDNPTGAQAVEGKEDTSTAAERAYWANDRR